MTDETEKGRTIQLFLTEGTPSGLTIATLHGWTGSVMIAHNPTLPDLLKRDEAKRTGVYVLYGPDPANDLKAQAYIGEADAINERLPNSAKKHTFWELAAVITTSDESLTKGHVRYLEAHLIQKVNAAGRISLSNTQQPEANKRYLPEADRANMHAFLANISLVLPVVGLDLFRPQATIPEGPEVSSPPEFVIQNSAGVNATMVELQDEYLVKKGSTAMKDTAAKKGSYSGLKQSLIDKGLLVQEGIFYRFTEHTAFSSPSAAAGVVLDRNANGRTKWKIKGTGKTYADWQAEKSGAVT